MRLRNPAALLGAASVLGLGLGLSSQPADACACGCGIFEVGTSSLFANGEGGTIFFTYDFLNQHENWSGTSRAPAADNDDKKLRTNFYTVGGQYMFNRDWGVMAEVPVTQRHFETMDGGTLGIFDHTAIGDIRLMGVYSGFSDDMSTGVIFGVKLPTGDSTYAGFDPDTEIGAGGTDLLLGGYHMGALDANENWVWYGQVQWDQPVASKHSYRAGGEVDAALGAYYNNWNIGGNSKLAPSFQILYSHRASDSGPLAEPDNTGYDRALAAPGIELDTGSWKFYADAEVPFYQDMRGNQLVAPVAYKFIVSYAL